MKIFAQIAKRLLLYSLLLVWWPPLAVSADSGKRIAVVIGNADYGIGALKNPVNDARDMAATLRSLGFEVIERTDASAQGMLAAIEEFGQRLRQTQGSAGLFYYAGHGVSLKGINYLIPVDAEISEPADIELGAVNIDALMQRLEGSGARVSFVILDACRNNPFAINNKRSLISDGLSRMFAPSGTLIAYATMPGATASDGDGDNGLYSAHLMEAMRLPGLTAEQVFKRTREKVEMASYNEQSPREESSLKGADFYFLPDSRAQDISPFAVEVARWESVRDSDDIRDFKSYLSQYPSGSFAAQAAEKITKLQSIAASDPGLAESGVAYTAIKRGEIDQAEVVFQRLSESSRAVDRARGYEGLADIALKKNQLERAAAFADKALQLRPNSGAANFIKAQIAWRRGDKDEVGKLLSFAISDQAVTDFSWQNGLALLSYGNVNRHNDPQLAMDAYQKAVALNPHTSEALTNLAAVLRDNGEHAKALDLLRQQGAAQSDRVVEAMAFQIQQELRDKNDLARQKQINDTVQLLSRRFQENKTKPKPQDSWTSAPLAISVLGFEVKSTPLAGRIGVDDLLSQELGRDLKAKNMLVVDRALINKLLTELNLGSSELADPETQLRLGRLTAARIILVGSLYHLNGQDVLSLRLIDTETSQLVQSMTKTVEQGLDPIAMAEQLAAEVSAIVSSAYPNRGRLAFVEQEQVIVNLGRRHGLMAGDMYSVLGEDEEIVYKGKVIGKKEQRLGTIRIADVDEAMAYAVVVEKSASWREDLRVEQHRPALSPAVK